MGLRINTNIDALTTQRHFFKASQDIESTLERLSSGLRINHAADDAAGMAISEKLQTQVRGLGQALENTQDGINLIQTAEGAMGSSLSLLQRIRELSVQSANDTLTQSERQKIQEEVKQLTQELDRIAHTTEFNNRKLLDGSLEGGRLDFKDASAEIIRNMRVGNDAASIPFIDNFITAIHSVAKDITLDSTIQFKLLATDSNTVALEVRSSLLGIITTFQNVFNAPVTYGIPATDLSASSALVTVGLSTIDPLKPFEILTPLQTLVNQQRINNVTYGNMVITAGGVPFAPIAITPLSTISGIIASINALDPRFAASFDPVASTVTVQFTDTAFGSLAGAPTPYAASNAAALSTGAMAPAFPAPPDGPAYPAFVPPAPGFAIGAPPPEFPVIPGTLDSQISYTAGAGTNASITTAFGLANVAASGTVSAYFGPGGAGPAGVTYVGEAIASVNPSEFVNRTRAIFGQAGLNNDMESTQTSSGADTGLRNAMGDHLLTFQTLSSGKVDAPSGSPFSAAGTPGAFTLTLDGEADVFDFRDYNVGTGVYADGSLVNTGFDIGVHTIQDVVDALNAYGATLGGGRTLTVSFDAGAADAITLFFDVPGASASDMVFGGVNGLALAEFFDVPAGTVGLSGDNTQISAAPIDNGGIDPSLELVAADLSVDIDTIISGRLSPLVTGDLRLNGDLVMTINPLVHTIQDVVNAVNGFTGTNGQTYAADFDTTVVGGLFIRNTDGADFAAPGAAPAASPGATQYNGSEVVRDSAIYAPVDAPQTYGAGATNLVPLMTGAPTGPTEFVGNAVLPAPYVDPGIAPSPALGAIDYSAGTSNISSVLFLPNTGGILGVPTGTTLYDGTIAATGHDTYNLTTTRRDDYQATNSSTSTGPIGFALPTFDDVGQVALIQIHGREGSATTIDNALSFQIGANQGQTIRVGIDGLTASSLGVEALNLVGANDEDSRMKAQNAIAVVDDAIEKVSRSRSRLGAVQNRMEMNISNLSIARENTSSSLSSIRDTDFAQATAALTRAQIIAQAGLAMISQANIKSNSALQLLG